MPKGGNCITEGYNCAIYDSKGNPGSHRCRALKGVPEDEKCICNPPNETRSGARCSFRADRNERRRVDRAAKKSRENSPSSLPKSLSPNIGPATALRRHIPLSVAKSPKLPSEVSPDLDPLRAMYAALQEEKPVKKTVRKTAKQLKTPMQAMQDQLSLAMRETSVDDKELKHPYATSADDLATSPKKTTSRIVRRTTGKQSRTTKNLSELSGTSAASVVAGDAELSALDGLDTDDIPLEPKQQKIKRGAKGPSSYNNFQKHMTEALKAAGITDANVRKTTVSKLWRDTAGKAKPVIAESTLAPGATLPPGGIKLTKPPGVYVMPRNMLTPVVEKSLSAETDDANTVSPVAAAVAGMNAFQN